VAAPFVGLDQHLVGDDVQLLLHLALHVLAAGRAQHAAQGALVDGLADALAGAGHHFEQQAQLARDVAVDALLLDQVAGEADALVMDILLSVGQRAGDDLAHVVGQVGLGGHAGDGSRAALR
jgi:hypothetical protein